MFFEEFSGDEPTFSEVVDETTKSASRKVLVWYMSIVWIGMDL